MADEAQLNSFVFACQGGLILDHLHLLQTGMALELQTLSQTLKVAIDVYLDTKWNSNIVPQDASSSEKVLMSAILKEKYCCTWW